MEWYQRGRPQTRNEAKNKRLIRNRILKSELILVLN